MTAAGEVLVLVGAVFTLLGAIGILRFDDVFSRMHPGAKSSTLGLLLAAIGVSLVVPTLAVVGAAVLVVVLQFLAGPVGAHMVGRAAHDRPGVRLRIDVDDELARDQARDAATGTSPATDDGPADGADGVR